MTRQLSQWIEIGKVARAHGVRGELRIHLFNPLSEALFDSEEVRIGETTYELLSARDNNDAVLVQLQGIDDRDQAEALKTQIIKIPRDKIPLAPGQYLLSDLIGCQAISPEGALLGEIVGVEPDMQDRAILQNANKRWLVPVVPEFFRKVDVQAGIVTLQFPEDLPHEPV